ncbi:MAG: hypothetical protein JWN49_675 [Parcubacteria group bacterium]|nr:hypothetical protein [Parcubacteria group bacterium]
MKMEGSPNSGSNRDTLWDVISDIEWLRYDMGSRWNSSAETVAVDGDTVRVAIPAKQKYLTVAMHYPDLGSRDSFLESARTRADAERYHINFAFEVPHYFATEEGEEDTNTADLERLDMKRWTNETGLTEKEITDAFMEGIHSLIQAHLKPR